MMDDDGRPGASGKKCVQIISKLKGSNVVFKRRFGLGSQPPSGQQTGGTSSAQTLGRTAVFLRQWHVNSAWLGPRATDYNKPLLHGMSPHMHTPKAQSLSRTLCGESIGDHGFVGLVN